RCAPIFSALSRGYTYVGEKASAANAVKLGGNFLIASMIEALGEAFAFERKAGVDPAQFLEGFSAVFKGGPILEGYARTVAEARFEAAGFALGLGLKDIKLVLEAGEVNGAPMPIASVVREQMIAAIAHGDGKRDWSVIARQSAKRAGL